MDFVRALGADEVIDYTQRAFEAATASVDLVLDSIGGDHLGRSLSLVKSGGALTSIVGGITPALTARAQAQGAAVHSLLVASSGADQAAIAARLADGRLRSHVARCYPFAQLPDALREVEGGKTQGKIVVTR